MPSEIRKLIFSSEDLREVVLDYCTRKGTAIPKAPIDSVVVQPDSNEFLTANFQSDGVKAGGLGEKMTFTREQVAAALILYCRSRKIPLPRAGEKVLDKEEDGVSLTISIGGAG